MTIPKKLAAGFALPLVILAGVWRARLLEHGPPH